MSALLLLLALTTAHAQAPAVDTPVEDALPALTAMPVLVTEVAAEYPAEAESQGIETSLLLEIDVDALGAVEDVRVVESAGAEGLGFDEAALVAVRQFVFAPAMAGEEPVPVRISYRYNFVLAEEVVPEPERAAPVVNFAGKLRERGMRTLLSGIKVTVFQDGGDAFEVTTDDDGGFAFYDLGPGVWKIIAAADGFRTFEDTEEVVEGQRTDVTLFVFREVTSAYDVVIEGERPRKEVSRHVLSVETIERIPGTFGDPIAVVQNLPGVSPTGFGDGTLIVRGSNPEDTGLFLNGMRIPVFYHFGGLRSVMPAPMLEEITFYPGNAPLQYGRLTGGVLEVTPKVLQPDAAHGHIDVNVFDTSVFFQAPVANNLSIAFGGRRSYIDVVLNAVLPEDSGLQLAAAPKYHDYQGQLTWTPHKDHDLTVFYLGSRDAFELLFDNPQDLDPQFNTPDFNVALTQQHLALYHDWRVSETTRNHVEVGGVIAGQDLSLGETIRGNFTGNELYLRDTLETELHDRLQISVGFDGKLSRTDVDVVTIGGPPKEGDSNSTRSTEIQSEINVFVDNQYGGFAELTFEPVDGLQIIGGSRVDQFTLMGETTVDPRITTRWQLMDAVALKGGVGMFHQSPNVDELSEGYGNPNLKPEAARHQSAGVEYTPTEIFTVDATVFQNNLLNQVSRTDKTKERNGETLPLIYDNGGEGTVRGLELLVKHDQHQNFSGWIAYTLSKAERVDSGETEARLFDSDRPHVLTAVASYRLPKNWELSSRFRYMSGLPYTPITGAVFLADEDRYAPFQGDTNSERQKALHTLDVRIDKTWAFKRWELDVYLDVQNVYNNTDTGGQSYNFDYTEVDAAPGMPIIPALGFRGSF